MDRVANKYIEYGFCLIFGPKLVPWKRNLEYGFALFIIFFVFVDDSNSFNLTKKYGHVGEKTFLGCIDMSVDVG